MDFYKILRVNKSSTDEEIEEAARRMLMIWNPEEFEEYDSVAKTVFNDVIKAKQMLLDPIRRKNYDKKREQISSSGSEVLIYANSENCVKYRKPCASVDNSNREVDSINHKHDFKKSDCKTQSKKGTKNIKNFDGSDYSACMPSPREEDRDLQSKREKREFDLDTNQNGRATYYEPQSLLDDVVGRARCLEVFERNLNGSLLKPAAANKDTFLRMDEENPLLNLGNKFIAARSSLSDCSSLGKDRSKDNNASYTRNGWAGKKNNNKFPDDGNSVDESSTIQNNSEEQCARQIHRNSHKTTILSKRNNLEDKVDLEDQEQNVSVSKNAPSRETDAVLDPDILPKNHHKYRHENFREYQSSFSYINNLADKNKNGVDLGERRRSLEPSLSDSSVYNDYKKEKISEEKNLKESSRISSKISPKCSVSSENNHKKLNIPPNVQGDINVTYKESDPFGKFNSPNKTEKSSSTTKSSMSNIRKYYRLRDGREIIVDEATKEFNSHKPLKDALNDKQKRLSRGHVSGKMPSETSVAKETSSKADCEETRENFKGQEEKMGKKSISEYTLPATNCNNYSNDRNDLKRNKETESLEHSNERNADDTEAEVESCIKYNASGSMVTAGVSKKFPSFEAIKGTVYYRNDKKGRSPSDFLQKRLNYSNSFNDIETVLFIANSNKSFYLSDDLNCNMIAEDHCSSYDDESKPEFSNTNQNNDSSCVIQGTGSSNAVNESSFSSLHHDSYSQRPKHSFNVPGSSNNIQGANTQPDNSRKMSNSDNNVSWIYALNENVFSQDQLNRFSMFCNSGNKNPTDDKLSVLQVKSETGLIRNNRSLEEFSKAKLPKALSYEQVLEINKTIDDQEIEKTRLDRDSIEKSAARITREQTSMNDSLESPILSVNANDEVGQLAGYRRESGTDENPEVLNDFQGGNYKFQDVIQDISAVNVSNTKSIKIKEGCSLKCTTCLRVQGGHGIDVSKLKTSSRTSYDEDGEFQIIKSVSRLGCLEMVSIYRFFDEEDYLEVYSEGNLVCRIDNDEPVEILAEHWETRGSIEIPLTMTVIMKADCNILKICRIREGNSDRIEIFKNEVLIYATENQTTEMSGYSKMHEHEKRS